MRALSIESLPAGGPVRADGLHRWLLSTARGQVRAPALLLKQLLPAFANDELLAERWLEAAARNTELAHSSCSNVLDFGVADGGIYLVSRYSAGLPLSTLMQVMRDVGEPMAHELVAHIGSELLGALAYVQESDPGLTHLDLDPAGLLLQADGTLLMPEFGLWSVLSPAELSRCRFDAGRVDYSSPELVRSRPTDARSDIFSVGVLLYELLSGQRPFVGKTQLMLALAMAEGTHRPLREVVPLAPESLCDIVEMMLASEANDRFQSAAAAQQALIATAMVRAAASGARQAALAALHAALPNSAWTEAVNEPSVSIESGGCGSSASIESGGCGSSASIESGGCATTARMESSASLEDAPPHSAVSPDRAHARAQREIRLSAHLRARAGMEARPHHGSSSHRVGEPVPPPLLLASGLPMEPPEGGVARPSTASERSQSGAAGRHCAASSDLAVNDGRTEHLRSAPAFEQLRAGPEPSRQRDVPELWPLQVPALHTPPHRAKELAQPRSTPEPPRPQPDRAFSPARAGAYSPQPRAETVDVPKPPPHIILDRPVPALSAVRGSEGVAFRLARPALREGIEGLSVQARSLAPAPSRSHSFSPQGGMPTPSAHLSPARAAGKWQDPSATLFQRKRPSNAPSVRRKSQPSGLVVAVLSALFGFSAVAGVYLVFRLCQ